MRPVTKKVSTFRLSSSTDTPSSGAIKVGYVRRAHGIKGAVIVRLLGDMPEQFAAGATLTTDSSKNPMLTVQSEQPHKEGLLVVFEGVTDRNAAEALRGISFLIRPEQRRDLDEEEFWPDDLVGLGVVAPDGHSIGRVTDVISGLAQDRLVVQTGDGLFEVPFVAAIVTKVDIKTGVVVIDAPDGLFS